MVHVIFVFFVPKQSGNGIYMYLVSCGCHLLRVEIILCHVSVFALHGINCTSYLSRSHMFRHGCWCVFDVAS